MIDHIDVVYIENENKLYNQSNRVWSVKKTQ